MGSTTVRITGGSQRVTIKGGATKRVTLDKRTVARIDNNRPTVIPLARNTPVTVEQRNTVVRTGGGMGVQGPIGPPGTDVGSHPTISAASAEGTPLQKGTPVTLVANKLRRASAEPPFHEVVGLVFDDVIDPEAVGRVQTDGPMEQPALAWETVTGLPGGLSPGSIHYLAPNPAGQMSPWAPTVEGRVVAPVGRAASDTLFIIDIDTQVHL